MLIRSTIDRTPRARRRTTSSDTGSRNGTARNVTFRRARTLAIDNRRARCRDVDRDTKRFFNRRAPSRHHASRSHPRRQAVDRGGRCSVVDATRRAWEQMERDRARDGHSEWTTVRTAVATQGQPRDPTGAVERGGG